MGQFLSEINGDNNSNFFHKYIMPYLQYVNLQSSENSNSNNPLIYEKKSKTSLTELARKFENAGREVIQCFGLYKLAKIIENTAFILRNIDILLVSIPNEQQHTRFSGNCEYCNLDFQNENNKCYCINCDKKCSSDISIAFSANKCCKHEKFNVVELMESRAQTNYFTEDYPLINASSYKHYSMKAKEKGSCETNEVGTPNLNDKPTITSSIFFMNDVHKKKRLLKSEKFTLDTDEAISTILNSIKTSYNICEIECGDRMEKKILKHQLLCPCSCEDFQKDYFKDCSCGCGLIIEATDPLEQEKIELTEYNDTGSDCPMTLLTDSPDVVDDIDTTRTLELLEQKLSRVKDEMISILAEESRNCGNNDHIVENLIAQYSPPTSMDFDRSLPYNDLKKQSLMDTRENTMFNTDGIVCAPKNFRIVRTILNCVHLAWDLPDTLCNILGYEIIVNGIVTNRVRSATRSQLIIMYVDFKKPTVFEIYSIAANGSTSESLTITFPNYDYKQCPSQQLL